MSRGKRRLDSTLRAIASGSHRLRTQAGAKGPSMKGGPIRSTPLRHFQNMEMIFVVGEGGKRIHRNPGIAPRSHKDGFTGDACRPNCFQSHDRRVVVATQKGAFRIATQIATLAENRIF